MQVMQTQRQRREVGTENAMKLVMEVLKPAILDQIETPDPKVHRDLKTLAAFIELYCVHNHANETRHVVSLRTHDVKRIAGRNIELCPQCTRLLTHAFVKRSHCPMNPKPACKHCPDRGGDAIFRPAHGHGREAGLPGAFAVLRNSAQRFLGIGKRFVAAPRTAGGLVANQRPNSAGPRHGVCH
jgi:hypothetical protein